MNKSFDTFLNNLAGAVDKKQVVDNMSSTYSQFNDIVENLKTRTDFPLEEGNPSNLWNHLAEYCFRATFMDPSFKELSAIAYEEWYEAMLRVEKNNPKRTLHKGMPLHQLGVLSLNNRQLAKRYFLLAFIEDVQEFLLKKRDSYIQPAYRVLNGQYKVPQVELEALKNIVEKFKDEKYPEKVLMEFLLSKEIHHEESPPQPSLKLNTFYLQELLDKAKSGNENEKGKNFTRLVSYLFSSIGGFEVIAENSLTKTGEHDYDLLIRNLVVDNPVFLNFGDYIIAECKFVDERSGIDVLAKLLYKLRTHECKCGILFSKKGTSFGPDYNLTIKKAFNRDSTLILVLDESDLEAIIKKGKTLIGALLDAYHSVRFEL